MKCDYSTASLVADHQYDTSIIRSSYNFSVILLISVIVAVSHIEDEAELGSFASTTGHWNQSSFSP